MSEDDLYELKDEPWMLKRVFTGEDFIETPTMNPNTIEQIIEQTGWIKGEPLEDLRGRLEKIGELVAPYCKVPAYKFTPAPPMDRRKMLFGGSEMKSIDERAKEWMDWWMLNSYIKESDLHDKVKGSLTELAADLQAEKEKEVAELWRERDLAIANARNAYENVCETLNKVREEKDAMSATIAQQEALLDEVKMVLENVRGFEIIGERTRSKIDQLLTRLGGSHE